MELTYDERNPMGNPWYLNAPPVNPTPQNKNLFPPVCLGNFRDVTLINKRMYPDIYIEQKRDVRAEQVKPYISSRDLPKIPPPLSMTSEKNIPKNAFIPGDAPYEKYSRNVDDESDLYGITRPLANDSEIPRKYGVKPSSDLYNNLHMPTPRPELTRNITAVKNGLVLTAKQAAGDNCSCPNNTTCLINPLDKRIGFNIATKENTKRMPYRVYNYTA
jgi:hypothetical protein